MGLRENGKWKIEKGMPYLKSAFAISLVTYVLLILADVMRPGFVSNYISAHWLLLLALVLFIILVAKGEMWSDRSWWHIVLAAVAAIIFGAVTWSIGRPLEELRPLVTLAAFFIPFGVLTNIQSK